ncbi:MAG: putative hydrolases or acyltransferases (alpha/beta hydrolase superfamily) [Porphyrobacter sp. HL-46]|nr:MAG: putative hydrolases or acyltransferases (alpha/beta hydrolase superfamily) [Porphyrobacter sp. HL-46]
MQKPSDNHPPNETASKDGGQPSLWHVREGVESPAGHIACGRAGSGPPIVLAHGWPWSSFAWHRVIPRLAAEYEVFWYDMPGYGRSEKAPDQATSLDIQGEILGFMLAHFGLEKPRVVAHDFGGAITLRAHLLHGCEYEALLLMNVVALSPWGSDFFDHVGRYVDAFTGLPPAIHEAVVRAYIEGALVSPIPPEDFDALCCPWLTEEGRGSFYRQFAQADESYTDAIAPLLADVRCPVKVIWGEDDPWIPVARGKELAKRLVKADFTPMPGVGHLPQIEAPQRVMAETLGFFAQQ